MPSTIEIRAVEKFAEPGFTALVDRLLFEPGRAEAIERYLKPAAGQPAPTPATLHRVRLGAFDGDTLVGWTSGHLEPGAKLYVSSSAVLPEYRRQGLYTRLVAAMEDEARALGCTQVVSHQRADNNAVIIAKLRLGYVIVGVEYTLEMGLLVKLSRSIDERRGELHAARSGPIERTMRAFGG